MVISLDRNNKSLEVVFCWDPKALEHWKIKFTRFGRSSISRGLTLEFEANT